MTYDSFTHLGTKYKEIIDLNLKRVRKKKLRELKKQSDDLNHSDNSSGNGYPSTERNRPNTIESSHQHEDKDMSCLYAKSCSFQNCPGCRRLK